MHSRDPTYRRLITRREWHKMSRMQLIRQPYCERCLKRGIRTEAVEVHHIHPVQDALSDDDKFRLMFDPHNLMSVCRQCHVELHMELGRSGKAWAKRHAARLLDAFRKRFIGGDDGTQQTPGGVF